jgi:hypothetical protein
MLRGVGAVRPVLHELFRHHPKLAAGLRVSAQRRLWELCLPKGTPLDNDLDRAEHRGVHGTYLKDS